MLLHLFIVDKLLVTWKYTPAMLIQLLGDEIKEGQIGRGVATRKGNKVWTDLSETLRDIPEYLESSVHCQFPYFRVSQIAIKIISFSFSFKSNSKSHFRFT